MKLNAKLKVRKNKSTYEGIDISWDLQLDEMYDADYEADDLKTRIEIRQKEIAAGTYYARHARKRAWLNGGEQRAKYGKNYMACSPKLNTDGKCSSTETKYDFGYWLNYGDDSVYGWFTVEQVQKWLSDDTLTLMDVGNIHANDERPKRTKEMKNLYMMRK